MTRRASLIDIAASWEMVRNPAKRRTILLIAIAVLALLCLFPRKYAADVKLAPQQPDSGGLSALLSQFGGANGTLIGGAPAEMDIAIGRSYDVKAEVAHRLGLGDDTDRAALDRAVLKLERSISVSALRGSVIEIEVSSHDRDFALRAAQAYSAVMQERVAQLSRAQTAHKIKVLTEGMQLAADRLTDAENAVSRFRQENQLLEPQSQFGAAVGQLTSLQAELESQQVQLQTALRFNGEDSFAVKSIRAAMDSLRSQIARTEARARTVNGLTASGLAPKTLQYERLNRELLFATTLYESYKRYIQGAAVEKLAADFNMQIIELPFIEPERQYNLTPLSILALLLLLGVGAEFYAFRPPVGADW